MVLNKNIVKFNTEKYFFLLKKRQLFVFFNLRFKFRVNLYQNKFLFFLLGLKNRLIKFHEKIKAYRIAHP
jgi:hypothetical protein